MKEAQFVVNVAELTRNYVNSSTKFRWRPPFYETKTATVCALKSLSMQIARGDVVGLLGPNGSGKTTLIKILTGLLQPTSGFVQVLGFTPYDERRRLSMRISTFFGNRGVLWPQLPVIDSIKLHASMYDLDKKAFQSRLEELSHVLNIEDLLDRPARTLSLGQSIRCNLAAKLIHGPELILLDEPTIGLDLEAKDHLRSYLKKLTEDQSRTVLITSHDMGDIENLCDRVVLLDRGEKVLDTTVQSLKEMHLKTRTVVEMDVPLEHVMRQIYSEMRARRA